MPDIWFPNLGIKIMKLNQTAISVAGIDIAWYGVFVTLGVIAGIYWSIHEAKRTGQNPDLYVDYAMYGIIACIIGARLYYVIFNWGDYKDNLLKIFAIREGGLAIYGAVIVGSITTFAHAKMKKYNIALFMDTAAPCLLLGQIIGRWGNFFNREAFGGYTDNILAMRLKVDQVDYISSELVDTIFSVDGVSYLQVHPTFFYESFWNLCVFLIIIFYKRRKKFDGEILAIYLWGYGLGRLWIEGLRTDQLFLMGTGIPVSQLLSLILVITVTISVVIYRKKLAKS